MNVFETLNNINVNGHVEKKNGLSYLSWAWAWTEVKKAFPDAQYTIYENANGWCYHTDGKTGWVKTGVTIANQEYIEYLPIMDFKNKSIPVDNITSFDVNKAIQRSLTKALARHGLGLYIYAGEDLPEEEQLTPAQKAAQTKADNKAEFEVRFEKAYNYLKRPDAKIQLIEESFPVLMKEAEKRKHQPQKQAEMWEMFDSLLAKDADYIPSFETLNAG